MRSMWTQEQNSSSVVRIMWWWIFRVATICCLYLELNLFFCKWEELECFWVGLHQEKEPFETKYDEWLCVCHGQLNWRSGEEINWVWHRRYRFSWLLKFWWSCWKSRYVFDYLNELNWNWFIVKVIVVLSQLLVVLFRLRMKDYFEESNRQQGGEDDEVDEDELYNFMEDDRSDWLCINEFFLRVYFSFWLQC